MPSRQRDRQTQIYADTDLKTFPFLQILPTVAFLFFSRTDSTDPLDCSPSFSANPSQRSLSFLLRDLLHGFPGLLTDTSEHIRFFTF